MDIVTTLRTEHDRVMTLIKEFSRDERPEAKQQLVKALIQELSVHEAAEEAAVWPEVRGVLDAKLVETALREEQELKQVLRRVNENLDQAAAELPRIEELLRRHLTTEQDQIFPQVTQKCDEATRNRLGTAFLDAKNALIDRAAKLNVTMLPETPVEQMKRT